MKNEELFDEVNRSKNYISFFSDLKEEKFNSVWTGDRYYPIEGNRYSKSYSQM